MRPICGTSVSSLTTRWPSSVSRDEPLARHAADEQVAAPLGETVARVDHQSGDADRRHPHLRGLLHAFTVRAGVDGETGLVVHAETDDRPSVVPAWLNAIELVASLRTVLVGPDVAGLRMDGEPLHVAMSVAPDLRPRAGAVDERIVSRHAPVVVQPDDLAVVIRQILRRMRLELAFRSDLPVAERQEQVPVAVEGDLAAEMVAALCRRPRRAARRPSTGCRQSGRVPVSSWPVASVAPGFEKVR